MEDITKMKVADLKRELKTRNLSTIGNKTELVERLQGALIELGVEGELLDSDLDDSNILAEDEILAETKEDDLLLSPDTTQKKIVLKRKSSFGSESNILKENHQPPESKTTKKSEHNLITIGPTTEKDDKKSAANSGSAKLSQLSEKERIELRKKKFGDVTSTATTTATANSASSEVTDDNKNNQIEKLKKRAERFGVVSPTIAKIDESEKLLKRKERFGLETASATASPTITTTGKNDIWAEKARQRLERFKTNEMNKTTNVEN